MLAKTLLANAIFSLITGLMFYIFQDELMLHIPAPNWFWMALSGGLILFAVQLFIMAKKPSLAIKFTMLVVLLDIAWVLISSIGWLYFFESIDATGGALIVAANIIVGSLAALQFKAYRLSKL